MHGDASYIRHNSGTQQQQAPSLNSEHWIKIIRRDSNIRMSGSQKWGQNFPAFNSIFSYILVWFIGFVYLQSNLLNWQRTECSSVFPHHHHHDMYLQLYQRISVITACISPACICGNLQCGLLHDTGPALLQIMTTNYSKKVLILYEEY